MQLYAITDRSLFASRETLLECVASWAVHAVDYVQIREKDLDAPELEFLAREIVRAARKAGTRTRILLNGPAEIAAATGCDGVHLPSGLPAEAVAEARKAMETISIEPVISISCHTLTGIEQARAMGASMALFAPIFEKRLPGETKPGRGLPALAEAAKTVAPMPVFALGGVDAGNARSCIDVGAAGIAAIRLFAFGEWRHLR